MSDLSIFVDSESDKLAEGLRQYLRGEARVSDLREIAWSAIDAWERLPPRVRTHPMTPREEVLWHAVWTTQHMADEEHRKAGISDPALRECLEVLERGTSLPEGIAARRP